MSTFGNVSPIFKSTDNTKSIQINRDANNIKIVDTSNSKTIIINSQEFSNGTQSLSFVDMYETVNACQAAVYPAQNSTTVQFVDTLIVSDQANLGTATTSSTLTGGNLYIQDINGAGSKSFIAEAGSLTIDDGTVTKSFIDAGSLNAINYNTGENSHLLPTGLSCFSGSTTLSVDSTGMTTGGLATITLNGSETISVSPVIKNQGGYIQALGSNSFNPTTLGSALQCVVLNNSNPVEMPAFSSLLYGTDGGWECIIINVTSSAITITTPDSKFNSWLRGVIGASYSIQANSAIRLTALANTITGVGYDQYFINDDYGYKTVNTTANLTHYLNFSDNSASGVGNIQKCSGFSVNPNTNTLTITDGVNSTVITPTSNPATHLLVASDNTSGSYYVPFTKTSAGTDSFYVDDTTGPLTYNPSTGTLTATTFSGTATAVSIQSDNNTNATYYIPFVKQNASDGPSQSLYVDDTTTSLTYNPYLSQIVFNNHVATYPAANFGVGNNLTIGVLSIGTVLTSGTLNIGTGNVWTTGVVNIGTGSTTPASINVGATGSANPINLKSPVVLSNPLTTGIVTPSSALQLGYQVTTLGASFTTTSLLSSIVTNIYSVSFTSANFGTYIFNAAFLLTPTDTTATRQIELSISTASATIQSPYFDMQHVPSGTTNVPLLKLTRTLQIYSNATVYLVGYCNGSAANVQTALNNGLFSYTRIA